MRCDVRSGSAKTSRGVPVYIIRDNQHDVRTLLRCNLLSPGIDTQTKRADRADKKTNGKNHGVNSLAKRLANDKWISSPRPGSPSVALPLSPCSSRGMPIASGRHAALSTARSCCTGAHTVVSAVRSTLSTARTIVSTLLSGANATHTTLHTVHNALRTAHSTLSTPQTGCTRAHTPLRTGTPRIRVSMVCDGAFCSGAHWLPCRRRFVLFSDPISAHGQAHWRRSPSGRA